MRARRTRKLSAHWHSTHRWLWEEYLAHLRGQRVAYLEIGVFEGASMLWMLDNILTHPESKAVGVDCWDSIKTRFANPKAVERRARWNLAEYGEKVELLKGGSVPTLRGRALAGRLFDVAYIDGDHSTLGVYLDSVEVWEKLRPGGVLIWDDVRRQSVAAGLRLFFGRLDAGAFELLHRKKQVIVRKREGFGVAAKGVFIKALWGDPGIERLKVVLSQVGRWSREPLKPEPLVVYAFGRANQARLRRLGIESTLLSEEPVVDFLGVGERDSRARGVLNYGQQMWRHKFAAIRHAAARYPAVVWTDWDVMQLAKVPEDFWARMAKGQPLQASLVQFRNPKCFWRWRGKRKLCDGSFVYVRGRAVAERLCRLYDAMPAIVDQEILALEFDRMFGTWKGVETYERLGAQPYCHESHLPVLSRPNAIFRTRCPIASRARVRAQREMRKQKRVRSMQRAIVRSKRTLVYGMQSSGATWVTWVLGQDKRVVTVFDLFEDKEAPGPEEFSDPVILKATVGLKYRLEDLQAQFEPQRTILVVRDEDAIRASLKTKKRYGRNVEEKLERFREALANPKLYQGVIVYEKFSRLQHETNRTVEEMIEFAVERSEWCRRGLKRPRQWGIGGLKA